MLLALLLTSLSAPTHAPARAYPIPPVPLHELVEQSDLIAVVRPGKERQLDRDSDVYGSTRVELAVEEVLVGRPVASVTTSFQWMLCPEPPSFPEGARLLVFLEHDKARGWQAVGLSYGTKLLDEAALDVYRARVRELAALIATRPKDWKATPNFVEWLVRCAEEPATRWEGAYTLDPTGDPFYDIVEPVLTFGSKVDAAQRARLSKALLAAPSIDTGEMCLLSLLVAQPDAELDEFALARLAALVPDRTYLVEPVMRFLAQRSGDAELQRMAREFKEASWTYDRTDPRLPRSVADFVQRARQAR